MKDFKIDYQTGTITITKKFAEAAGEIGSKAFKDMEVLRGMGMAIITRQTKPRKHPISFAQMAHYISCVENREFYMKRFEAVKDAAKSKTNCYADVRKWFNETFPTFGEMPEFNDENKITVPKQEEAAEESPSQEELAENEVKFAANL